MRALIFVRFLVVLSFWNWTLGVGTGSLDSQIPSVERSVKNMGPVSKSSGRFVADLGRAPQGAKQVIDTRGNHNKTCTMWAELFEA